MAEKTRSQVLQENPFGHQDAVGASAGRRVLFVDPRLTSQRCSRCGAIVKKDLSERWHSCSCGCELDRDHNAALNILCQGQEVAHRATAL